MVLSLSLQKDWWIGSGQKLVFLFRSYKSFSFATVYHTKRTNDHRHCGCEVNKELFNKSYEVFFYKKPGWRFQPFIHLIYVWSQLDHEWVFLSMFKPSNMRLICLKIKWKAIGPSHCRWSGPKNTHDRKMAKERWIWQKFYYEQNKVIFSLWTCSTLMLLVNWYTDF